MKRYIITITNINTKEVEQFGEDYCSLEAAEEAAKKSVDDFGWKGESHITIDVALSVFSVFRE